MKTILPNASEFISGGLIFLKAVRYSSGLDFLIKNQNSLSLKK
jgi:hypothetical protein